MFKEIPITDLDWSPFPRTKGNWFLVTAGKPGASNALLGTLGGFLALWGGNCVEIFIRESRFTKHLLDEESHFSISVLPPEYKDAVHYCGTHSGKDGSKWTAAGLTETAIDGIPTCAEASLTLLCRKLASVNTDKMDMAPDIREAYYTGRWEGNPYTLYIGEIVKVMKASKEGK